MNKILSPKVILFFFSASLLFALLLIKKIYFELSPQDLNLILISVDTLRPDHMGIYGYDKNTTPNIDKWAEEAKVFTNAYTIFPLTSHSFYTLFTGRDDVFQKESLGLTTAVGFKKETDVNTITKILKSNKFKTAAFITNPMLGYTTSFFKSAFDQFSYIDTSDLSQNSLKGDEVSNIYNYEYQNAQQVTKEAADWLTANNRKQRLFLWLHYTTPHWPYNPPQKYICAIDNKCNLKESKKLMLLSQDIRIRRNKQLDTGIKTKLFSDYEIGELTDSYDAEILSVDEQIGKIFEELKRLGIFKKSLIILYGDHGESFDHNLYFEHGYNLYNSDIRIPLIFYYPVKSHFQVKQEGFIDNTDILPTILNLLKISYNQQQFTGVSHALGDKAVDNKKEFVFSLTPGDSTNKFSILNDRYKYIYSNSISFNELGQQEELYNLIDDPMEKNNIIDKDNPEARYFRDRLMSRLKEREKSYEDDEKGDVEKKDIIDKLRSIGY